MTNIIDRINEYLSDVLLFGDYKDKKEVINKLIVNTKIIIGVCITEFIYYFYSVFKNNNAYYSYMDICYTMCIISAFRILYLLHILKKL